MSYKSIVLNDVLFRCNEMTGDVRKCGKSVVVGATNDGNENLWVLQRIKHQEPRTQPTFVVDIILFLES